MNIKRAKQEIKNCIEAYLLKNLDSCCVHRSSLHVIHVV